MPKYVTIEAVRWATRQLFDSCNGLIVDFLILKHVGLTASGPVNITTTSTAPAAKRLMGITDSDGQPVAKELFFFNPFVGKWRHDGYPRSGTYSTLSRSKTFERALVVTKPGKGLEVKVTSDYVSALRNDLRRSSTKPLAIPESAFAIWASRYDSLPDSIDLADLKVRIRSEYSLSDQEVEELFTPEDPEGLEIFSSQDLDRNVLISFLQSEYPDTSAPHPASSGGTTLLEDMPADLLEYLRGELLFPTSLLRQLVTLVRAGKHIILTGPPGTGKSTLAARLADASARFSQEFSLPASSGKMMTTATADWSTYDTLGGYMPEPNGGGSLVFNEGIFLASLSANRWLVIDELNRADVDKAFGQFFTVLSGHNVVTGFKRRGMPIRIVSDPSSTASSYDEAATTYVVGRDWRLIGTMNTFDRNLLFQISSAFLRRFAVVHVGIPSTEDLIDWIQQRDLPAGDGELVADLLRLLSDVRPLGPAIWGDLGDYLEMRSEQPFAEEEGSSAFAEAVVAFILPQLDGLDFETLAQVEAGILDLLPNDTDRAGMRRTFKELFH